MRAELEKIATAQPHVMTSLSCAPGVNHRPSGHMNAQTSWAGYQTNMASSTTFFVSMTWVVPTVTAISTDSYMSVWPGLGTGTASDELVQAGTAYALTPSVSAPYFWYELYPQESEMRVTSLSVAAGDQVDVVANFAASASTATFSLYNLTKNTYTSLQQKLASGQTFKGNQAEWIVERPLLIVNGVTTVATLAHFSSIPVSSCNFEYTTQSSVSVATTANSSVVNVMNSSNQSLVSLTTLSGGGFTATWNRGS